MEVALKSDPHCRNCIHLVEKKGKMICKGHWNDEINPEHAGHKKQQLTTSIAIYEVTCPWYFPTHEARVKIETAIREMGREIYTLKQYTGHLEKELVDLKKDRKELVREEKVVKKPKKKAAKIVVKKKTKKPVKRPKQRKALKKTVKKKK
ncbi:MAG: hypothetical protein ABIE94_07100 [archaeon]